MLPPPDISTAYVDDKNRPTKDLYNWIKSIYDTLLPVFGGATALSGYSEGTFTPALQFGGAATGLTYDTQVGRYVRIGKLVTFWITIVVGSNGTSTGNASIEGLPFVAEDVGIYTPLAMYGSMASASLVLASYMPFLPPDETAVQLYANDTSGGGGDAVPLTEANIVDGSVINVSGSYIAA